MREGATSPSESAQLQPGAKRISLTEEQWSNVFGKKMLEAGGVKTD